MRKNHRLTLSERADAVAALRLLEGSGISLEEAVKVALHLEGSGKWTETRMDLAIDAYLVTCRERVAAGTMAQRTAEGYDENLWAFERSFSGKTLDNLTRKQLDKYFSSLPVSTTSKLVRFRAVRAWLNWCERQDPALLRTNPIRNMRIDEPSRTEEIGFLSIDEVKQVLKAPPPYRWAFALQLFAGLRPEEISSRTKPPLLWEYINRMEKEIRIPAAVAKGSQHGNMTRIIDQVPPAIWYWLEGAPDKGRVFPFLPGRISSRARQLAGYIGSRKWPQDGLRHTFATYHVAAYNDAPKTSLIMGHRGNPDMIHRHYRGLAKKTDAQKFFALRG